MHTLANDSEGKLALDDIEKAIRPKNNIHYPETTLLCLENTHNRCGGAVLTPEYTSQVAQMSHPHGLKVHLDGARIFNAAIALNVPASKLTKDADSVSFCLSKGLSAPVGSLLCGSKKFVERARKWRKMVGGGMRQAGVLAAAGIVALETMIDRLVEDHANARRLADGLVRIPGITLAQAKVPTNILMFDLSPAIAYSRFVAELAERGVKVSNRGGNRFRAVTNRMITATDTEEALNIIDKVCGKLLRQS